MLVAVGYGRVNKFREEKYHEAKTLGYELISYVSSTATMWPNTALGDNCFIMENNVIQPFATIGNNVLMWSGCQIGHDSVIGDNTFLGAQAVVSGRVIVEPNCFIGVNATIRDMVTIGRECVIGAGAIILKSTQPRQVFVGEAAKLLTVPSNRLVSI
jgi:sugar O-acyltransferase (sialic acid O-acetyltransferase NeuD family)